MTASGEFLDFIKEQLAGFGPVTIRRMFGGAGIYRDGLMFALIADETLYLKADGASRSEFESLGLPPFSFAAKGAKKVIMSYWRAPEVCLDDPDQMTEWAGKAFAAALRSRKPAAALRKSRRRKSV
jgi:DNA transformation protein